MFENYANWTISSEAPVGWRTFTDYPCDGEYINRNIFGNSGYFCIKSCNLPTVLVYLVYENN
ncbi:MAG: hypothetical protein ACTSX1_00055 [Candidatus Heimdallarchaeaceae archaeon]